MEDSRYINTSIEQDNISLYNDDEVLFRTFFDKSADNYMERKEKIDNGEKTPFAWYAFLFSLGWLLYRKMYVEFFISLGIFIAVDTILEFIIGNTDSIDRFINLAYAGAFGVIGNMLYIKKANRTVKKAMEMEDEQSRLDYLNKKGGVSILSLIIFLVLYIGLIMLLLYTDSY